jgi:histone deacetylase 8
LQDDCPVFPELSDYVQLVAEASTTAARILRDGEADVAINWTGGR